MPDMVHISVFSLFVAVLISAMELVVDHSY